MAKRRQKREAAPAAEVFPTEADGLFPETIFPEPVVEAPSRSKYIEAAGQVQGWAPASEVFDLVEAVPTCMPGFNRAVRVGGVPVRRIHTIHGPTHGGKTAFVLAIARSFADPGYLVGYVDAEHALDRKFAAEIAPGMASQPNFMAKRPNSYEDTIVAVDAFLAAARKVREKHPEACSAVIIDSITKLVPERELEKILKEGATDAKGAKELAKGHHGRYRAALNQGWLDQLVPKMAAANCALILIAQEREEADPTDFYQDFKVKGGAALLFDAALVCRVMKAEPVFAPGTEKKSNDAIVGWKHRVRIWKSKVGHMDGRWSDGFFHLKNDKITTPGLDTARDALEVGADLGVVNKSGSWFSYQGRRWQGETKATAWLEANPERLHALLSEIGAKLREES